MQPKIAGRSRVPYRLAADTFGTEELEAAKTTLDSGAPDDGRTRPRLRAGVRGVDRGAARGDGQLGLLGESADGRRDVAPDGRGRPLVARRRGPRTRARMADHGLAPGPAGAGAGLRRHRSGHPRDRPGERRVRALAEDEGHDPHPRARAGGAHGAPAALLPAPSPRPAGGFLREPRRPFRGRARRHLRRDELLQLLFLPSHLLHRGRNAHHRRRGAGRRSAQSAGPRLGAGSLRSRAMEGAVSGVRRAIPLRLRRLQRPAHRDAGRDRRRAASQARSHARRAQPPGEPGARMDRSPRALAPADRGRGGGGGRGKGGAARPDPLLDDASFPGGLEVGPDHRPGEGKARVHGRGDPADHRRQSRAAPGDGSVRDAIGAVARAVRSDPGARVHGRLSSAARAGRAGDARARLRRAAGFADRCAR